jgi:hypothetical protein
MRLLQNIRRLEFEDRNSPMNQVCQCYKIQHVFGDL